MGGVGGGEPMVENEEEGLLQGRIPALGGGSGVYPTAVGLDL